MYSRSHPSNNLNGHEIEYGDPGVCVWKELKDVYDFLLVLQTHNATTYHVTYTVSVFLKACMRMWFAT